jgi:seryl-tRNA synthetase
MPFITGKIVNKNVVRRTEYDEVVKEREQYFDQYEEQRNYVRNFSKTIDEQTEQIKQKDKSLLEQTNTISKTIRELDSTKLELKSSEDASSNKSQEIDQLKNSIESLERENSNHKEKLKGYENLYFNDRNREFYSTINKFPPEILNKVQELKRDNKWNDFLHLGQFFEKGGSLGGELLTEMIERGLAFERGNREDFTPIGHIIYRYNQVFKEDFDERLLLLNK